MFGQLSLDITLLLILYAVGATVAAMSCLYLLLRRGNAFAPRIITPRRLRRWTAVFFGALALGHVWYLPAALFTSSDAIMLSMLIGALLDCMVVLPLAIVVMLCMLQDRRRPLWPVGMAVAPLVVGAIVCIVTRNEALVPMLRLYFLPLGIGLAVYMVRELRRYGRWLRDNYADLEHKEVWQSIIVLAAMLLMFGYYVSGDSGMVYEYIIQVCCIALVLCLLWRVETLQDLETHPQPVPVSEESDYLTSEEVDDIERLLQQHCIDTRLYLQHDLTINQLAHALGTNRTYLSQYFSSMDTTYNTYINTLRINYFVSLYREAMAAGQTISAKQLAARSGYRSYSTFSLAFKQRMDQSVTDWMRDVAG